VSALTIPDSDTYSDINEYRDILRHIGGRYALDALIHMLNVQTEYSDVFYTAWNMLTLAFSERRADYVYVSSYLDQNQKHNVTLHPLSSTPLNDEQMEILKNLIAKEQLWEAETNLFNLFSLPDSRGELKQLLAKA
jgi:hypothetical protein